MAERDFDETTTVTKQRKILPDNILSEDGTLKFDFMTSLQNITMAKIACSLWMHHSIQQEVVSFFHYGFKPGRNGDKWQEIENIVAAKVSELLFVNSITKKLTNIVPFVGNSIVNWIGYHDSYIFNTGYFSEYSAVHFINNIKWTSRGIIDYGQTAKDILANRDSCLNDDHKYKLACIYCLEDEIRLLAPKSVNQYLCSVELDLHPMVYFWTMHLAGQCNWNMGVYEYILRLLINDSCWVKKIFNEVPIRYIWDKLNKKVKDRNITLLFYKLGNRYLTYSLHKLGNQDLTYSLLSTLNYEQQQKVFKMFSGTILCGIFTDWLWEEYFLPTALYVLDIMHPASYLAILQKVIVKLVENSGYVHNQYKIMFKQLWQEGSKYLKDFVFELQSGRSLDIFSLSSERDMDIIELIFNDLNTQQKKNAVFGYDGIKHCVNLILNDQWDSLELFIKNTLSSEDISWLKECLIKNEGRRIAAHFLKGGALYKIEYFMEWALESEAEVDKFRQSLASTKYQPTFQAIIASNIADFTELDKHLEWCAKGNLKVINQFKAEIPKTCSGKELFSLLIKSDRYELLDQVLNWCFLDNQQIRQFKSNMYRDDTLVCSVRAIISILTITDYSFKLLDKFIDWSFTNAQEVQEFKIWMLYPQENMFSICTSSFLIKYQFELANKLIERCLTSPKDITKFKKKLMLSTLDIKVIFQNYFYGKEHLSSLIKWFNPSKETAAEFKELFVEKNCPDNFYKLLDEFVHNQTSAVKYAVHET